MIRVVHLGFRGQKGTESRIRIRNTALIQIIWTVLDPDADRLDPLICSGSSPQHCLNDSFFSLLQVRMQLKTPPKWLRRPCGASFGFGGKLVTFENGDAAAAVAGSGSGPRPLVHLSRVITETELVERSGKTTAGHRVGD
jgi:hypothetical protein